MYTDTIEFSAYNDDYDYFILSGKKDTADVSLIYNWDTKNSKYNFIPGERIKITWKMDGIPMAGDEDVINHTERLIDAERFKTNDNQVKFLWRAAKFDEELNQAC
ncbi:hypothetical protein [Aequorivita sp. Q41]|uniref:hypothetical protein n=1 Tax=Aequorivita sp. Q41 TaxID=3153300 RepID=UPI003241BC84